MLVYADHPPFGDRGSSLQGDPEHSDDSPTVVRRRGDQSERPQPEPGKGPAPAPLIESPHAIAPPDRESAIDQVLLDEEARRARAFAGVAAMLVVLVALEMPWLGGDPQRRVAASIALLVMFGISAWAWLRTRRPDGHTPLVFRVTGWGLTTCMLVVQLYMGFFSPVTVVLSLGIYYLGQATDRRHAKALALYVTLGWVVGCVLIMTGVVEDRGLYTAHQLPLASQLLMVSGVACSLLATMWFASLARASVRRAVIESTQAMLVAQKRDALLQEAHGQLDQAMRLVVGKVGLHTGKQVGDYRLSVLIGVGAMGEVYAAEHVEHGGPAAVKLLQPEALRRDDMVQRFLREAELCLRFDHRNLVKVLAVGRLADEAPYMVMERIDGLPLSVLLRDRGNLLPDEVVDICEQICAGLTHAHARGVVHRDLKPHNILRARDEAGAPCWKLLDFGISKLVDSSGTLTGHDGVLGTPAYMSPEQARGQAVDQRSDLFSLGVVMYRALTGRPAFPGKEPAQVMFNVAYCMPEQPSLQVEGLRTDFDYVLALALAKGKEHRFATAEALVHALREAAAGKLNDTLRARARVVLDAHPWGWSPPERRS